MDAPIPMNELRSAVTKGKPNKVPGGDGISQDFYKIAWETIKHELLEIVNLMYVGENITDKQKHGIIVYIPKTPHSNPPEEYRNLTLLNADLKLLVRILAEHMSPWLTSHLHPSQHCGIYMNTIFDATAIVRRSRTRNIRNSHCAFCL
jgi:hypothetical protein